MFTWEPKLCIEHFTFAAKWDYFLVLLECVSLCLRICISPRSRNFCSYSTVNLISNCYKLSKCLHSKCMNEFLFRLWSFRRQRTSRSHFSSFLSAMKMDVCERECVCVRGCLIQLNSSFQQTHFSETFFCDCEHWTCDSFMCSLLYSFEMRKLFLLYTHSSLSNTSPGSFCRCYCCCCLSCIMQCFKSGGMR